MLGGSIPAVLWAVAVAVLTISTIQGQRLVVGHGFTVWQSWTLPAAVDLALTVALVGDQVLAGRGLRCGWGGILRWGTALTALVLNCGQPVLVRDWFAVGLHSIAPLLLLVTVEAATAYQRLLATVPPRGSLSSQLKGHTKDVNVGLVQGVDPMADTVRTAARELEDQGTSPSRAAVGDALRAGGHSVSTGRLSELLRTVKGDQHVGEVEAGS